MNNAQKTLNEINKITGKLIELGLCDNQNFGVMRELSRECMEVTYQNNNGTAYILKNVPYDDLYSDIRERKDYNISLLDGALIQMQYLFKGDDVIKHRLGFFPSPYLIEFQNCPEMYNQDLMFAEIVGRQIVVTPFRFDFDVEAFCEMKHPKSHVTIGQYQNCRIPMRSALVLRPFLKLFDCRITRPFLVSWRV